jgi:toluene monooxygenase system ferredoxin subunit
MSFQKVATTDELWDGEMTSIQMGNRKILLVHVNANVYAYEDRCAHKGVLLSQGTLEGTTLICSAHLWEYDVCSGQGINPKTACLKKVEVCLKNQEIWVNVES